ncbi:hypothetical protein NLJ89_g4487 [Agrocybe chaxingu]|uniref:Uncharacterized protein n=1 Tax=Agrocybe chaxingu TaxID=84603 RepID=A0A9W8K8P3_9AGAR|nr:hypothetical protein NLJ89_g4487 [Agrocybe chaxingu]
MFDNQQPALSHLSAIRLASRESARRLQKYSARLLSSVSVIMTAAQHTIAVSKTVSVGSYWSLQRYLKYFSIPVKEEQQLQKAFAHTIEAFDVFNRDLTHLNGETYESLLSLDGLIENFVDLIYDEALGEARKKLDELLNRLWTIMGGNR